MVNDHVKQSIIPVDKTPESYISRVVNILECLSQGTNSLTAVAKQCDISASSTHKILSTLVGPNLVIYDPINHRYYLGPTVIRLASNPVTSHRFLIMIAKDEMSQLSSLFKESITLDAMVGISFIPLHAIYNVNHMEFIVGETVQESRPVIPLGNDKILLSQLSNKKLLLALKLVKQQIIDYHIELDMEAFEKQMEEIRQRGYIISHREKNPDGYGISVPINNYSCPVSLTIFGPETHFGNITPSMIKEFVESAKRISNVLHRTLCENKSHAGWD